MKILKKLRVWGGRVWGVRLDVNEELKLFCFFFLGGGVLVGGSGWGCQGGCERRIEVFEKNHKQVTQWQRSLT